MIGETRVINIRSGDPYDLYIGRRNPWKKLIGSKWANPFKVGDDGLTREEAIARYREHVLSRPDLVAALPELRGKVLACWCKPEACHGDVLVELLEAQELGR